MRVLLIALLAAISYAQTDVTSRRLLKDVSSRRLLNDPPECDEWKTWGEGSTWCIILQEHERNQCSECTAVGDAIPKKHVVKLLWWIPLHLRKTEKKIRKMSNSLKKYCEKSNVNCRQEDIDMVDAIVMAIDQNLDGAMSEVRNLGGSYQDWDGKPNENQLRCRMRHPGPCETGTLVGDDLRPFKVKQLLKLVGTKYLVRTKRAWAKRMKKILDTGLTFNPVTHEYILNLWHACNNPVTPADEWLNWANLLHGELLKDYDDKGEPKF